MRPLLIGKGEPLKIHERGAAIITAALRKDSPDCRAVLLLCPNTGEGETGCVGSVQRRLLGSP